MGEKKSGEITVFLSLILTCICALMCGLLESARLAGSGWYLQMAADSALDSLLSKYHREVWENYHLLLLEFEDKEGLEAELLPWLDAYLTDQPPYYLENSSVTAREPVKITAENGRYLEREILDYMKLGVWTMEQNPDKQKTYSEEILEADSLGEITERYQTDTAGVMKLERTLENIGESLKSQEQYLEKGKQMLRNCNGSGFIREAEKLKKELNRMPGLIDQYEKEADVLAGQLAESKAQAEEKKGDLKEETWQMVSGGLESCRAYIDKEGERRKEVERSGQQAADNLLVVEAAIEEAEETKEYIDEWEADDDDDELEEEELWEEVLDTFSRFKADHTFAEPAVKDKKKMKLLENIGHLAKGDLLSLVVPEDREVSKTAVDKLEFPSETAALSPDSGQGSGMADLVELAFINEYTAYHFTNFETGQEKNLQYEQEYILNGKDSDRENLKSMVDRIVGVREAMNLISLYRDSDKRNEARTLAAAITGAVGLSPLTEVTAFFILTVWALAESLEDVKTLLSGGKVPFIKNAGEWKLSLEQLLAFERPVGNSGVGDGAESGGRGLDYQGYLKLFLILQNRVEKDYRIMDMIQENISRKQSGFLMDRCAYRVDVEVRAKGRYGNLKRNASKAY